MTMNTPTNNNDYIFIYWEDGSWNEKENGKKNYIHKR